MSTLAELEDVMALVVQNDGNVVIYDHNNYPLWATNTVVPAYPAVR